MGIYSFYFNSKLFIFFNLGDVKNLHRQKIRSLSKKQPNQFFDHCKWFLLTIKLIGPTVGLIIWMVFQYSILQKARVNLKLLKSSRARFMKLVNLSSSDNVFRCFGPNDIGNSQLAYSAR